MKRALVLLIAMVMVVGLMGQAQADLVLRGVDSLGNGLIYDTGLNVTWYDYTRSVDFWHNQVNWAAGLTVNFGGNVYDDWRLPTTVDGQYVVGYDGTTTGGWNITSSEMGHLYYVSLGNKGAYDTNGNYQPGYGLVNKGPFQHLQAGTLWSGTKYSLISNRAWRFSFYDGSQYYGGYGEVNALAVRPGDVSAVPIPGAIWLLGSGLAGLYVVRKKTERRHG